MKRLSPRLLGLLLLGALALHTASKDAAHLQEMLWTCHMATAVMALGLLVGAHRWVAGAFLLHVGFGTAIWLVDLVATRETTLSSLLVHGLPLTAGALEVRRKGWPPGLVWPTWLLSLAWIISCRWTTDPALNVNLSQEPWPPLAHVFGGLWLSSLFHSAVMLGGFLLADRLLRSVSRQPPCGFRSPSCGFRSP